MTGANEDPLQRQEKKKERENFLYGECVDARIGLRKEVEKRKKKEETSFTISEALIVKSRKRKEKEK